MRLNLESKVSLRFERFTGDFNPIEVLKIDNFYVWNLGNLQSSRFICDWWWHSCKCEWMSLVTNESFEFHKHEATKKNVCLDCGMLCELGFLSLQSMAYAYWCWGFCIVIKLGTWPNSVMTNVFLYIRHMKEI